MKFVTDIKKAAQLTKSPVIALDIETNTDPSPDHPSAALSDKFGLSYVTDMIALAITDGDLTLSLINIQNFTPQQHKALGEFLVKVFCREVIIVGANVLFDLRHVGGHYKFTLPTKALVWDVQVMQRRMLLIPAPSAKLFSFSLKNLIKVWNTNLDPEFMEFMEFMKDSRASISDFLDAGDFDDEEEDKSDLAADEGEEKEIPNKDKKVSLSNLAPTSPVWKYAGGFAGTAPDVLEKKGHTLLARYVATDAEQALDIYYKQLAVVPKYATEKTYSPIPGVNMNRWPELPGLVLEWQKSLRVNANIAIRGLPVNMEYLEKRKQETHDRAIELAPKLLFENDSTDPYPQFKEVFAQLVWYAMVLDLVAENKTYHDPRKWANWQQIHLDPEFIASAMSFSGKTFQKDADPASEEQNLINLWANWLVSLNANELTRGDIKKAVPDNRTPPRIDLQEWMRQQCFAHEEFLVGNYKAMLKTRWLKTYYQMRQKQEPIKLVSARHFQPYFIFAVAGWPLYGNKDLRFELGLGTTSFQKRRKEIERSLSKEDRDSLDLQRLAIEMDAFSCSKKAIEWIFSHIEDSKGEFLDDIPEAYKEAAVKMRLWRELQNNWSVHKRMTEYWLHAQKDNRIHTLLVPNTVTGRDGSTLPNLQNIKMKDFAGVFVAPDGMTLVEFDLNNAENNMQIMVTGDENFAADVNAGDYHSIQMELYWPEKVRELIAANDKAGLSFWRSESKKITFAGAYGAGPGKIASLGRMPIEEAYAIIERKNMRYPKVAEKKERAAEKCLERYNKYKIFPAYTILWHGERVMVDSFDDKPQVYRIFNYLNQGGIVPIVHNAMFQIEELTEARQYKTHILLSVHDSVIAAVDDEEFFNTNVVQEICEIICSQVPEEMMQRTIPAAAFVTEYCPSNAKKWGKRVDREYPYPPDMYINRYGRWSLNEYPNPEPKDKDKAPTWKGDWSKGWTLESMMEEQRKRRQIASDLQQKNTIVAEEKIHIPVRAFSSAVDWPQQLDQLIKNIVSPVVTAYIDDKGIAQQTPTLLLTERTQLNEALMQRGSTENWNKQRQEYEALRDFLKTRLDDVEAVLELFK